MTMDLMNSMNSRFPQITKAKASNLWIRMLHSSTRYLILQLLAPRALPELLDVLGLCQLLLEHLHYFKRQRFESVMLTRCCSLHNALKASAIEWCCHPSYPLKNWYCIIWFIWVTCISVEYIIVYVYLYIFYDFPITDKSLQLNIL